MLRIAKNASARPAHECIPSASPRLVKDLSCSFAQLEIEYTLRCIFPTETHHEHDTWQRQPRPRACEVWRRASDVQDHRATTIARRAIDAIAAGETPREADIAAVDNYFRGSIL